MIKHCFFLLAFVLFDQIAETQNTVINKWWNYSIIKPDTAIDYYFGKEVIDPYRNIENLDNEQVKTWMKAENNFYDVIIQNITNRKILQKEIKKLVNAQKLWVSFARGAGCRIFYSITTKADINSLLYTDDLVSKPVELFNTKTINKQNHKNYFIDYFEPSYDGKFLVFGMSSNGDEKADLYIINVMKKELLLEKIESAILGNPQWLVDGSGFFYIQEKDIITENDKKNPYEGHIIKLHLLNTDIKKDKEIFSRAINKELGLEEIDLPMLFTFPASDKVLLNIQRGLELYCSVYSTSLIDIINKPAEDITWTKIFDVNEKVTANVVFGDQFYGLSFKSNPNGQIITKNLYDSATMILFDSPGFPIEDMVLNNDNLYATLLKSDENKLVKINLKDSKSEIIDPPIKGGISIRPPFAVASFYQAGKNFLFGLDSYTKNFDMYLCDTNKKINKTNFSPEVQYKKSSLDLVVKEVEVESHDGVMVPLTIVYKNGIKLNGNNPTIVNAYGAFGISIKPQFDLSGITWYDRGGIYAFAHVRGGYEKGDSWYKGGFKATKPNSWKDLIACAEYLVKNKYTSSEKLAAMGASAGGITVGRAITERPELFKTAVIYSGTLNILRIENTDNTIDVTEFGTIHDSLEFQYMYSMDPYQHIAENVRYPSVLFSDGTNDTRVAPWQPAKMAAKMQQVSKCDNIVLFRLEDGGHFDYPPSSDVYSFLLWQLGHPDFKLKEKDCMFKSVNK